MACAVAGCLLLAAGCSTTGTPQTLAEQGPESTSPLPGAATGTLVVFTAPTQRADPIAAPRQLIYSDYHLQSEAGKDLGTIKNHSDSVWEGPVAVSLSGGRYRVTARANGMGTVIVPVRVVEGRTTTVHLDTASSRGN